MQLAVDFPIHHSPRAANEKPRKSGASWGACALSYSALTTLTVRRLFGPLTAKSTLPSFNANNV